jgi:hypothetical protein
MAWLLELTTADGRIFHHASFGWSLASENHPKVIRYEHRSEANEVRPKLWHGHNTDRVRIRKAPENP